MCQDKKLQIKNYMAYLQEKYPKKLHPGGVGNFLFNSLATNLIFEHKTQKATHTQPPGINGFFLFFLPHYVSVETISRMERGVSIPSLKTLENIANSLNTPLKTFFDFDEHQPGNQSFERELSKLIAFLRTLRIKEITLIHEILKVVSKRLKKSTIP